MPRGRDPAPDNPEGRAADRQEEDITQEPLGDNRMVIDIPARRWACFCQEGLATLQSLCTHLKDRHRIAQLVDGREVISLALVYAGLCMKPQGGCLMGTCTRTIRVEPDPVQILEFECPRRRECGRRFRVERASKHVLWH